MKWWHWLIIVGLNIATFVGTLLLTNSALDYHGERLWENEKAINDVRNDFTYFKITNSKSSSATFDPSSQGYQRIETDNGSFLLSLSDLQPYADGYKAFINIGNPNAASFGHVELDVAWGAPMADGESAETFNRRLKTRVVTVPSKVEPAAWNKTAIVLSPAEKADLGFIRVGVRSKSVYLRR